MASALVQQGTPLDKLQDALDLMSSALEEDEDESEERSHGESHLSLALYELVEAWRPQLAALRQAQGGLCHISGRLQPTWR